MTSEDKRKWPEVVLWKLRLDIKEYFFTESVCQILEQALHIFSFCYHLLQVGFKLVVFSQVGARLTDSELFLCSIKAARKKVADESPGLA